MTPEAPRLIAGFTWTYQKLPFHFQAKGEFEYVGPKMVGNGCNPSAPDDLTAYCLGVPNKEFRLTLARPFLQGKINLGLNMRIARGYIGQTVENSATDYRPAYLGPFARSRESDCRGRRRPHTLVRQSKRHL